MIILRYIIGGFFKSHSLAEKWCCERILASVRMWVGSGVRDETVELSKGIQFVSRGWAAGKEVEEIHTPWLLFFLYKEGYKFLLRANGKRTVRNEKENCFLLVFTFGYFCCVFFFWLDCMLPEGKAMAFITQHVFIESLLSSAEIEQTNET